MTQHRIDASARKTVRLTVLFTEGEMAKLDRVCAYYTLTKSEAAHDMIMVRLNEVFGAIDETAVADMMAASETAQIEWREKLGLA